jgi:hypothetical protein
MEGVVGVQLRAPKAGALRPVSEPKGMLVVQAKCRLAIRAAILGLETDRSCR